jgi:hypothetical protein
VQAIRITSTLKIAHKKRGLDSLPLAFYVGVMQNKLDGMNVEKLQNTAAESIGK